jgi:MoaA/NifB/PqqE/SkfB family radical SAM enzyme
VRIKLDWIHVSIDAASPETYRQVRNGNFKKLLENLRTLADVKRQHGSYFPSVRFSFCLMKQNIGEMVTVVELAHECGVDEVNFEHLIVYQLDLAKETAFGHEDQVMAAYRAAEERAANLGVITTFAGMNRRKNEASCPFSMFTVLTDGTVGFCGAQRALVGSIIDGGPREIWNSPHFQNARNRFANGKLLHQCERCPNATNAALDFIHPDMSYVADAGAPALRAT